jgi:putative CocE/NonD family hydrolase
VWITWTENQFNSLISILVVLIIRQTINTNNLSHMRRFCSLLLLLCAYSIPFSQSRPALPGDFFEQYNYTLPAGFNYKDEPALKSQLDSIAQSMLAYIYHGENDFTNTEDNTYYERLYKLTVSTHLARQQEVLQTISQLRTMKPAPAYRAPAGLMAKAYILSTQQHSDDHSPAFAATFKTQILTAFNELDPAFRNDIVSSFKGFLGPNAAEINKKDLTDIIDQSVNLSGSKLPFYSAIYLLQSWFTYYITAHYQKDIDAALYQLSPVRVAQKNEMIPMRDGIHLNASIYYDSISNQKVPAVISLSPYPTGFEGTRGNVFASNGYTYVYVDNRGRNKSEGEFFPYENDAQDFYDIIDWVSKQPWCNGQVVTSGGSYLGFTQWQAIRKKYKHPALKAINPMVAVGFGVDFPRFANQFYSYILQWATYVSGKELNDAQFNDYEFWNKVAYTLYKNRLPFSKMDSVAGLPNPFFQKWVSHPDFDSYWKSILPSKEDFAALNIPVLTITGYYDGDQNGAFYYYNNHLKYGNPKAASQHYILIGPYDHGGAQWQPNAIQYGLTIEKEAQIPIYKYVIWWYDWILKGKQRPDFLKNKVNYFVNGSGTWKSTSSFNAITHDTVSLYLSPQSMTSSKRNTVYSLNKQKGVKDEPIRYQHDIAKIIDSAFVYATPRPFDDSLYMTSPYNLVFESAPLEKDITVTGRITASLFLSLNVPDADFMVNIYEMDSAGRSFNIANTLLRSRYRNGGEKASLLKPGQIALHNFNDVFLYIKKIKKGNRLRFVFESVNSPIYEKNYGFGGVVSKETTDKPRIVEATIHTGPKYPSRIIIPVEFK